MEFMVKLYKKHMEGGRVIVHEHPAHAKSRALPCIRGMMREVGVDIVEADQCMYGLETWGRSRSHLVLAKNPNKFMTNSRSIGSELRKICDGSHAHQPLVDGRAKDATRCPPRVCAEPSAGEWQRKRCRGN